MKMITLYSKRRLSKSKQQFIKLWNSRKDSTIKMDTAFKWFKAGETFGHELTKKYFLETAVKQLKNISNEDQQ